MKRAPRTLSEIRAAFVAGDHEGVLSAFADLDVLLACCRVSVASLVAEIAHVVRESPRPLPAEVQLELPSGARLDARGLALLAAILEENRELLAPAPDRLFPILFRELHWREPGLARLAEHFRATFDARPEAYWLRPLLPPETVTLTSWRVPGEPRSLSADGRALLLSDPPSSPPTGHLARRLLDPVTGQSLLTIAADRGVSLSPDGACVALFGGKSGELWSPGAQAPYATLAAHDRAVQRVVFARDSRVVFTEASKVVRAARVADGASVGSRTIEGERHVSGLLPAAEGAVLVHDGKRWLLWEYREDRLRPIGDADYVVAEWSAVSPSGDRLIAAEGTGAFSGWSLPDGELLFRRPLPEQVSALAFHPSGALFTGGQRLYDASTGREVARLPATLVSAGRWPSFDPTGRFLVTRHDVPEAAQLWDVRDLANPSVIARFRVGSFTRGEPRAHFGADGRVLVFGDARETVVVDLGAALERPAPDDTPRVSTLWPTRFSPSGTAVVFGHDRALSFWDVTRGVRRRLVAVDRALGYFAAESRVLVRIGDELAALDAEDGAEVWRTTLPGDSWEEAYAADEQGVVLHCRRDGDGAVAGLDMRDGQVRFRLPAQKVLLHDRDVFVSLSADGARALREASTGDVRISLPGLRGGRLAISPDHRWLAASEYTAELWDLTTGTRAHDLGTDAQSLRFREDSLALVATSSQSPQSGNTDTVSQEIYDVLTGQCIGSSTWDEYGYGGPSTPKEIAPGIVQEGSLLRVGDRELLLPSGAVVAHRPSGPLHVAGVSPGNRVELYHGGTSHETLAHRELTNGGRTAP